MARMVKEQITTEWSGVLPATDSNQLKKALHMNVYKTTQNIILALTMSLLTACAQEGPYVSGKVECDFSVSSVSSTIAVVSATLPKNDNLINEIDYSELYLTEKNIDGINSIVWDELIEGELDREESDEYHIKKFFSKLKPNTTYYPVVKVKSSLNGPDKDSYFWYNSGFSFKTTPSNPNDPNDPNADYVSILNSVLKTTTCEVIHYAFGYAQIDITLPDNIDFCDGSDSAQLRVSTSPDMKDYQSYDIFINNDPIGQNGHYGYTTIKMSEDKKYYFEVVSGLTLFGQYHDWMPDWNENKEVTIRIEKPINSAELQQEASASEVTCSLLDYRAKVFENDWSDDSYEYFTVVRINMPSNVRILNYAYPHVDTYLGSHWLISLQAFSISDSDNVEKAWFNDQYETYPYNNLPNYDCKPNEYVFAFSVLKKDKYKLKLNCCVDVSGFIIDDITINVDNILDLTNVSDN